ncbi:hypothetical protein [Brevundimonas kwangchunensis]|uniref:hypothetical protein n=1 Tax=Brevundimonas kwangchunensis TaxID=322163 RepID=UPI0031D5AB95
MEHHRLRKYRGPETWRRVREAYLAGESARAVALRFDVGESNVRRKAMQEGWTRKTYAGQHDLRPMRGEADGPAPAIGTLEDLDALPEPPPVDADQAIRKAARRAAWLIGRGQATEAMALLRAAETLSRMRWATKPGSGPG